MIEVPNRMRDRSSSCGSGGELAKVISGLSPVPVDDDARIEALDLGRGMDVEQRIGRILALEADRAMVELEVAPGEIIIAAHQVGPAGEARRVGEATDVQAGPSSGC